MKIQPSIIYPQTLRNVTRTGFQVGMIVLTLFLILYYNFAYYLYVPLTGVWLDYVDKSFTAIQIARLDSGSPGDVAGLNIVDKEI